MFFSLSHADIAIAARPNVLILLSDDQRADTIAALGNSGIRTPNLDGLVQKGTSFTRAYCMGSLQGAVCVPSRAMLLSGRSLFHVKDDLSGQTIWPEAFSRAGYTTFLTGKWHNQPASALRIFQRGRAVFLGGMGDPYALPIQDIGPSHTFINQRLTGEHSIKIFADAMIEFLRANPVDQPFLAYVAFNTPHDPRVAPRSYHERYERNPPPLPANFLLRHPFDNGALRIRDEALAPWPRTPEVVRSHLADYYAAIEHLDDQVGRILEALESTGHAENTIVVFASDHGLAIGSHGLMGKQNLYEHSMRTPLIFRGPGIPRGRREAAFCYLFDVLPTVGELAGVTAPEGSEGFSLTPVLRGEVKTQRSAIFTAYGTTQRAIREERWKLIDYPAIHKRQLFDLEADPDERVDLATDPAHAMKLERLKMELQARRTALGDPLPVK
jgi:arylsulfatase A-like enzyme